MGFLNHQQYQLVTFFRKGGIVVREDVDLKSTELSRLASGRGRKSNGADVEELEEENLERDLQGYTLMTLVSLVAFKGKQMGGEVCGHFSLNF